MHAYPIQPAKVQRPPLRPATLRRRRLIQWLDGHVQRRLLLIIAEAGYGKTTLLADWARTARIRIAWYRIDDDDANFVSFVHYLVAAGRVVDPSFGAATSVLLDELAAGANNRPIVRVTLIQELAQLAASGPVVFVLDDYHEVTHVAEIRDFMSEVLASAPAGLTFVILARRKPGLPVSRLRAMGEVAELGRRELQFRVDETEELFRDTYARPIEADVLADLVERTEGWAASLQLVDAAIRDRTLSETRSFIRGISGAQGDLYDYLAEEVVGDLPAELREFLMRTSVLREITLPLATLVTGLDEKRIQSLVQKAQGLSLLDAPGPAGTSPYRYHPLVREFLEARLRQELGDDVAVDLHRRVAIATEATDWRTAAHHYEHIGAVDEVHRLLIENAGSIMARGEFDVAKAYVDRLDPSIADPAMDLFVSRIELDQGRIQNAVQRAKSAHDALRASGGPLLGVAQANYASILMSSGDRASARALCVELVASDVAPSVLEIAQAMLLTIDLPTEGGLSSYQAHLSRIEEAQRARGDSHYLGVTLLNLSLVAFYRGQAEAALAKADEAIELLRTGSRRVELAAASLARARALAHLGEWDASVLEMTSTIDGTRDGVRNEAMVEAADIWTSYGDSDGAHLLLERLRRDEHPSLLASTHLPATTAEWLLRSGEYVKAASVAEDLLPESQTADIDYVARRAFVVAHAAVRVRKDDAHTVLAAAEAVIRAQEADYFLRALELVRASSAGSSEFDRAISRAATLEPIYISMFAELVADRLDDLSDSTYGLLDAIVARHPARWLDPLRSVLNGNRPSLRAARLLEIVGTRQDIGSIRRIARSRKGRAFDATLGRRLARRLAPRLLVEDLGRVRLITTSLEIGEVVARRKVLELVCYLITRPDLAATRDEVADALWPDADPLSAVNSLNQTLYSLRRAIEPGYMEDLSPNYVRHESDVVWLDAELITGRSLQCRQILRRLEEASEFETVAALANAYRGRFALDFAYEEWSAPYREMLHASYLHAMEAGIKARLNAGQPAEAVALTRRVLEIDPTAEQIHRLQLRSYFASSSHAALREQYARYAIRVRDELGVEPPSLAELIAREFELE